MAVSPRHITTKWSLAAAGISTLACLPPLAVWAGSDGLWKNGEEVYAKVCGYCHQTGIGPVIKGRKLPPEHITFIVRRSLRAMPAFPASFIDDQALTGTGSGRLHLKIRRRAEIRDRKMDANRRTFLNCANF